MCKVSTCRHFGGPKNCPQCKNVPGQCDYCDDRAVDTLCVFAKAPWKEHHKGVCNGCYGTNPLNVYELCFTCHSKGQQKKKRVVHTCRDCEEIEELHRICERCESGIETYASNTLLCMDCFYTEGFIPEPNFSVGVCRSCKNTEHLNGEGICRNCFRDQNILHADNEDWGKHNVCERCRKSIPRGEKFCDNCQPLGRGETPVELVICEGCDDEFYANSNFDTFCHKCKERMERGVCTRCGNMKLGFNRHGHCLECERKDG